ncbi:hypothetical protein R1flu_020711 [Riccia fluitans]|uniref:SAC domain-containing protein n=1 Tax=Riccia fluitans TaxID=41844 RepID=A0ABD1ZMA3_9MARC
MDKAPPLHGMLSYFEIPSSRFDPTFTRSGTRRSQLAPEGPLAATHARLRFRKFLEPYYLILVTKRRQIGTLCGHPIYGIEESQMITVPHSSVQTDVADCKAELRYKKLLSGVDLTKDFFFSYTYRIMQSLQRNILAQESEPLPYENMFVWNADLTRGIRERLNNTNWTVALVHGYFEQAKLSIYGRIFVITLISRRSRHFAGTRYLKRGVNDNGKVANDVETEQIVVDEESGFGTTPGQISSVVQNRGSIPLFWSQEASKLSPKPDIILHRIDPIYKAANLHFQDLEQRYGNPIIVFNLIKTAEKRPREMMLRREFANAVGYLNTILAEESRLNYIHWDFHKFNKSKANVLAVLGAVAGEVLDLTGIFYSGKSSVNKRPTRLKRASTSSLESMLGRVSPPPLPLRELNREFMSLTMTGASITARDLQKDRSREKKALRSKEPQFQCGVLRTNCIDCLDRTNVAQFAYGLAALGRQLYALGLTDTLKVDSDSGVSETLMSMYQKMGDALALQYGGSAAHNTVFPEKGKWKATTQSREFLKSIRRYYSNTYTDGEKQDAINLFLGHFQPQEGKPALWELDSDYYLHVGGYGGECTPTADGAFQKPVGAIRQNLNSAVTCVPAYRADYHLKKLTSFDKLLQISCGPIKNVRMYSETERKVGSQGADAVEVQLRSPNWLYGQRKNDDSNTTSGETQETSVSRTVEDQAIGQFTEYDWLSSFGIKEWSLPDKQLETSEEDEEGWYGTSILPGTVSDSKANQHYLLCCNGPSEDEYGNVVSQDCSDLLSEKSSAVENGETDGKEEDVEAAMRAALQEYEKLGTDMTSIMPGGEPSVEFTTNFGRWVFRPESEESDVD